MFIKQVLPTLPIAFGDVRVNKQLYFCLIHINKFFASLTYLPIYELTTTPRLLDKASDDVPARD